MGWSVPSACLLLLGVCVPSGYYSVLVMALVGWGVVALLWALACLAWLMESPVRRRRYLARLRPLLIAPALFAASWAAASGDLVGRAVFPWHQAALERLAAEAVTRPPLTPPYGGNVGLYNFEHISSHNGCVFMSTDDRAMGGGRGFAWCPGRRDGDVVDFDGQFYLSSVEEGWFVYYRSRATEAEGRLWGLRLSELSPPVET
ncbi:hypothetical protein JOF41_001558 [Saccharothrix coeruleofusca]|uniref:hypothetical protein n=1 Tax=Saccharothrix coeruleofusca TaxID=33919 RepID=UPI001AE9C078|nr:hypothetical protein [Saccharothrix coeruleofusca]MBP2335380.1 hypothetical protein [Saccharothrix coeruleofusca]